MKLLYKKPEIDIEIVEAKNIIVTSNPGTITEGTWTENGTDTSFDDFMKP